jgi:5-formyltetrahydrofolate cyclo-ligase
MIEHKCLVHDGKISAMELNAAAAQKAELRTKVSAARAARQYNPDEASELNIHLAELCIANGAKKVACYLPFGNEPDTELFIDWALDNDIEVLLPVSKVDGTLDWVSFDGDTQVGIFGFHEATGATVEPNEIDIAIIPALAVDTNGIRLGKGKGFYDRALLEFKPLPTIVAVVFDSEVLPEVPAESHDHPVDAAVTPSGIKHFTQRLK